jgi:transcriptional regulator with XRE-family HTH domain
MPPPRMPFVLLTPSEIAFELGRRLEALRLATDWRRATLAERTGLSVSTIQRFERTGKITLEHLLLIAHALGRAEDFASLFQPEPARSLDELEQRLSALRRQRGRR